jgi:nicotinate-nucleotide adenylyltransferase
MKIGLYFGSFNPVHIGHLIIGSFALHHTNLEQVWFVVSPQNPHKSEAGLLNEYHRLHLVNLAIEGELGLKSSSIEFGLPKPSYTIDTLTYLEEKYPEYEFSIIMGEDSLSNLHKWKSGNIIRQRYPLYVYKRRGSSVYSAEATELVNFLDAPLLDISSSYIRQEIRNGKPIKYLVTEKVEEEILNAGYYR